MHAEYTMFYICNIMVIYELQCHESNLSIQNLDPCFKIREGKPTWAIHLAILCKSYVAAWVVH